MKFRRKKGTVITVVLVMFMFITNLSLALMVEHIHIRQSNLHLVVIDKHLALKYRVVQELELLLKNSEFEELTLSYQDHEIHLKKDENNVSVSIQGTFDFTLKYDIIDYDSLKWRQIE